jgi:uncharacterized protein YndB with AHSA1/START domain
MTSNTGGGSRILGSLRSVDGTGVVRIEERFDTDIDDLWSAVTDPSRLARWLGEVEGDLRLGGTFRARFFATGWEGTGRIDACEPPRRFVAVSKEPDARTEDAMEITLIPDGGDTILVLEHRGIDPHHLAGYGAGNQIHIEDLAAYLAGRERVDANARWQELMPAYQALLADVS